MRYYVYTNPQKTQKVYIHAEADTRQQLARFLGGRYFTVDPAKSRWFHVNEVWAEPETLNLGASVLVGGLLGLFAGGVGALIGAAVSGGLSEVADTRERTRAETFNSTIVGP